MHIRKDKGRTEKNYPHSNRERQGKNCKTLPIFTQGKTREKQRNKSHFHIGKDKGRTEKHYPYSYRERQGKNRETKAKGRTREGQGKDSEKQNPTFKESGEWKEKKGKKKTEKHFVELQ